MKTRMLALILLLALCLSFCACGGGQKGDMPPKDIQVEAKALSGQTVPGRYRAEELPLPEGLRPDSRSAPVWLDDRLYYLAQDGKQTLLCVSDPAGADPKVLSTFAGLVWSLCDSGRGTLCVLGTALDGDSDASSHNYIAELSIDGGQLWYGEPDAANAPKDWLPTQIRCRGDRVYLLGGAYLSVQERGEGLRELYSLELGRSASLTQLSDGSILLGQREEPAWSLRFLDDEVRAPGTGWVFELPLGVVGVGLDRELYLSDGNNVYSLHTADKTPEKRFAWGTAGVLGGFLVEVGDGQLLCLEQTSGKMYRLSPSDPSPDGSGNSAAVLTLATVNESTLTFGLTEAIRDWNQSHPDCIIQVHNYFTGDYNDGNGEDTAAAIERLALDITTGNIPDLYDFSQPLAGEPINAAMFARKGYLADLYPFMDREPVMNRAWFYAPLLSAMEIDGGLYELTPSFSVLTAYCYGPDIGEPTNRTYEALGRVLSGSDYYTSLFNNNGSYYQMQLLYTLVFASGDKLVDWSRGTCDFNSDYFLSLLQACQGLPKDFDPGYLLENPSPSKQLAASTSLLYLDLLPQNEPWGPAVTGLGGYGAGAAFAGLPEVGSVIVPEYDLGISAYSSHQQECWEFLCSYLKQYAALDLGHFSASRANMEHLVDWWLNWATVNSDEGHDLLALHPGVEAAMEDFMTVVSQSHAVYRYDSAVWGIVESEAERFFAGEHSAQETGAAIQSRVMLYLAEQG